MAVGGGGAAAQAEAMASAALPVHSDASFSFNLRAMGAARGLRAPALQGTHGFSAVPMQLPVASVKQQWMVLSQQPPARASSRRRKQAKRGF